MSIELTKENHESFLKLISSIMIKDIQFMEFHSRKTAPGADLSQDEINISWKQDFADGDPLRHGENEILFRPKYEFSLSQSGKEFFHFKVITTILFSLTDRNNYDNCWAIESVRSFFLEKQVMKTMWPILRQNLMDIMSRHSLTPIILPWIF